MMCRLLLISPASSRTPYSSSDTMWYTAFHFAPRNMKLTHPLIVNDAVLIKIIQRTFQAGTSSPMIGRWFRSLDLESKHNLIPRNRNPPSKRLHRRLAAPAPLNRFFPSEAAWEYSSLDVRFQIGKFSSAASPLAYGYEDAVHGRKLGSVDHSSNCQQSPKITRRASATSWEMPLIQSARRCPFCNKKAPALLSLPVDRRPILPSPEADRLARKPFHPRKHGRDRLFNCRFLPDQADHHNDIGQKDAARPNKQFFST